MTSVVETLVVRCVPNSNKAKAETRGCVMASEITGNYKINYMFREKDSEFFINRDKDTIVILRYGKGLVLSSFRVVWLDKSCSVMRDTLNINLAGLNGENISDNMTEYDLGYGGLSVLVENTYEDQIGCIRLYRFYETTVTLTVI